MLGQTPLFNSDIDRECLLTSPGKLPVELVRFSHRVLRLSADQLTPTPGLSSSAGSLVLIHRGRCGSTVLGAMLDQNEQVYWDGEALMPPSLSERWLRRLQGARGVSNIRDLKVLMRYARTRSYVLSCKGQPGCSSISRLVRDLSDAGFDRFAVLERKNALRWLVSAEIGSQRQRWHLRQGDSPRLNPVWIPLLYDQQKTLADRLHGLANWHKEVRDCLAGRPVLNLTYEDHVETDPARAYREVCEFMDVTATPVRITQARLNPFPLTRLIANFNEVETALRRTGLEWMLQEQD